jgi:hypothetical protein
MTIHRTPCEVIALDARHLDWVGLIPVTVVLEDGRAGMYLANAREAEGMARALADDQLRANIHTYQLIVDLQPAPNVTPKQEHRHG